VPSGTLAQLVNVLDSDPRDAAPDLGLGLAPRAAAPGAPLCARAGSGAPRATGAPDRHLRTREALDSDPDPQGSELPQAPPAGDRQTSAGLQADFVSNAAR
jgi:hypothetical protein